MTLANLIAELQRLAATTPDGGQSLSVLSIYNDRGHYDEAFPIWDTAIRTTDDGVPVVVLACK